MRVGHTLAETVAVCSHCGKIVKQCVGAINRARKLGAPLYCDMKCAGLARRVFKTKAQKVVEKRLYDAQYRQKNRKLLKAKKRAYFLRAYDPMKAAKVRKARMHLHVAYCQQPRYRRWKKRYDQRHRAGKCFGPFAESFLVLLKLENEISSRISRYEVYQANGTLNKTQERKRAYARLIGYQPKGSTLGNLAGN